VDERRESLADFRRERLLLEGHVVARRESHGRLAALAVGPRVRGDREQVGARLRQVVVDLAELREGAQQGVLDEVLGVPDRARERAAEAVEVRAVRRHVVEEAHADGAHGLA
jgi:hypothetical protein